MENNETNRIKWTKELVISEVKVIKESGEPLNASHVMKVNSKLYGAARKHLGSWKEAVELAGYNYEEVNLRSNEKKWNKEEIITEIKRLFEEGEQLNSDYIQKNFTKLHSASQRYFDSWGEAVDLAGFDYEEIKGIKWTEETVTANILALSSQGEDLSSSNMQRNHMSLFQAGCRIYGSWKDAVNSSGLDYSTYRKQKEWTLEKVNEEIRKFQLEHGTASAGVVSKKYGSLYQVARRFTRNKNKDWDEIVKEALEQRP